MAICHEMNEGDVFFCKLCGLELRVEKTCSCGPSMLWARYDKKVVEILNPNNSIKNYTTIFQ
jgi:hypothetical protein